MIKIIDKTLIKFLIVGIINTAVGTIVMFSFYNLFNFSYWFSTAANYTVGSIVSFFLNKRFTFNNLDKGIKPLFRFIINIIICYFLAYGVSNAAITHILSHAEKTVIDNIAMVVGMVLFVTLNYLGQRLFVFKERDNIKKEWK